MALLKYLLVLNAKHATIPNHVTGIRRVHATICNCIKDLVDVTGLTVFISHGLIEHYYLMLNI